jgi:hypothetical protein
MVHRLFSILGCSEWPQIRKQRRSSIAPCRPAVTFNHVHRSSTLQSELRLARAGVLLALFSSSVAWAQAPDPSNIAEGGRPFRQKANCQACHARKSKPAASFRNKEVYERYTYLACAGLNK